MTSELNKEFQKQLSFSIEHQGLKSNTELLLKNKNNSDAVTYRKNIKRRNKTTVGVIDGTLLQDLLKCSICNNQISSPKQLPCQHTFCKKCLEAKLEEVLKKGDGRNFCCPTCRTPAPELSTLPRNRKIEKLLEAVEEGHSMSESRNRPQSLFVNYTPTSTKQRTRRRSLELFEKETKSCVECEADNGNERCEHCSKIFCNNCRTNHALNLKQKIVPLIENLQLAVTNLEHQVKNYKETIDKEKESIAQEIDAKIAKLMEEKHRRLKMADDAKIEGEASANEIKQKIWDSQIELDKLNNDGFDKIDTDKQKITTFAKINKKTSDIILSALQWETLTTSNQNKKVPEPTPRTLFSKDSLKLNIRPKLVNRKDLQRPSGIALDSRNNEIYVTCHGDGQILVFDSQYKIIRKINDSQMMAPKGIAFNQKHEEIYVSDKWKHCIFVFNREGQLLRIICNEGQLRCPEGLSILQSHGWLYVADTGHDRIQIFGRDGAHKGGIGPPEYELSQPTDVVVNDKVIAVADCGNHKIKVFTHKGSLLHVIGGFGTIKGRMKFPEVVNLNAKGQIIVGDSENCRIQVFSLENGSLLRTRGIQGTSVGQLGSVSGLECLPNGDILVADSKNNTLQLF